MYVVFTVGETVILAVVCPPVQLYVEPPDAVSVTTEPRHIVEDGLVLIVMVGVGIVISCVALLLQPFALVPVTVYVVFTVGITIILVVVCPDVQRYVAAPDTVSVAMLPLQIVEEGLTLMLVVGNGLTAITCVAVFVQPFEPVTV